MVTRRRGSKVKGPVFFDTSLPFCRAKSASSNTMTQTPGFIYVTVHISTPWYVLSVPATLVQCYLVLHKTVCSICWHKTPSYSMSNTSTGVQSPPFGYLSPPIDVNDASSDDGDHLQTPLTEHSDHQPFAVLHQEQYHFSHNLFHSEVDRQGEVFSQDSAPTGSETGSRSCPPFSSLMTPSPADKASHTHSTIDPYFPPFSPPHALDLANASLDFNPFSTSFPPSFQTGAVFSRDGQVYTPTKDSFDFLANPFDSPGPSQANSSVIELPPLPSLSVSTDSLDRAVASSAAILGSASGLEPNPFDVEADGLYMDQARAYSPRFPVEHALNPYFVRTYHLGDELGAGGYGFVMTAKHRAEGYEVAVKFIIKEKVPEHAWWDDEVLGRVPTEVMVMSLISHENIVKCLDLFEDDLYFYLVREPAIYVTREFMVPTQVQELHGTPWVSRRKKKVKQITAPGKLVVPSTSALSTPALTPSPSTDSNVSLPSTPPQVAIDDVEMVSATEEDEKDRGAESSSLEGSTADSGEAKENTEALLQPPPPRPNFSRRPSYDLFECIEQSKHKRLSENTARFIFAQVVEAVFYLDSQGITHCDIKDENIVIDSNFKVRLSPFALTPCSCMLYLQIAGETNRLW
ncbi:hypothetical protein NM688_g4713 [Phlebia brevispora]|uniref:Uncharacterized protein n=1 Tax=Phlebia brevispora TaxID=194682 RepID=A0ACC1T235_9APHY|nr:hypothetical protein NM688_g4713 [Phlebia brevispora]